MATKKTSTSKAVATWDEELAKQAEVAAGMEANTGGGQFFSLKGGQLKWQDAPLPGNQMAVVILDGVMENVFYEGEYDPDTPQGPTCFAFGRDEKEMAPHIIVSDAGQAQSTEGCSKCEHNEWGSAERGRGKACRNTRRLALIPAGTFDQHGKLQLIDDEDHYASTAMGFMKLPVTSVKGYASFVKSVAGALKRPPHGIITKVSVVSDASTQFKVLFEPLTKVPDDLMAAVMARHQEATSVIEFPYQLSDDEAPPSKPKRGSKAASKPARGRKY